MRRMKERLFHSARGRDTESGISFRWWGSSYGRRCLLTGEELTALILGDLSVKSLQGLEPCKYPRRTSQKLLWR